MRAGLIVWMTPRAVSHFFMVIQAQSLRDLFGCLCSSFESRPMHDFSSCHSLSFSNFHTSLSCLLLSRSASLALEVRLFCYERFLRQPLLLSCFIAVGTLLPGTRHSTRYPVEGWMEQEFGGIVYNSHYSFGDLEIYKILSIIPGLQGALC